MAHYEDRRWTADEMSDSFLRRRDRRSCRYHVYFPDELVGRRFRFSADVTNELVAAEQEIRLVEQSQAGPGDTEVLARLLLCAESVASSRIEGLVINSRRLLRADLARQSGEISADVTAREVLANIDAMAHAVDAIDVGRRITSEVLLEMHAKLLRESTLAEHAGTFRTQQNWIGGSTHNPCDAVFVPPPPDQVELLVEDLCAFSRDTSLPVLAQAAIAHAQFETIHPFVDGNGRVGRALIHMILRYRKLTPTISLPVSLVLATSASEYVAGLTAMRYDGTFLSSQALDGLDEWVGLFARACRRAASESRRFAQDIARLEQSWRGRIHAIRKQSTVDLLLSKLTGAPVVTVQTAAALVGRSFHATNQAIETLVTHDILRATKNVSRNRTFEAVDVLRLFTGFERRLASPAGDTRIARPNRTVPALIREGDAVE